MPVDQSHDITIVTACDRNYLWGSLLLACSAARWIPDVPLIVFQTGFTDDDKELLTQFPNVQVKDLQSADPRTVAVRKPEALLGVDSEYVAWLDADCFIYGDILPCLIPDSGQFQIRFRGAEENADVWRNHYEAKDEKGAIPQRVLNRWQKDVNERKEARFKTACVTNSFVIHRNSIGLIQRWQDLIVKVLMPRVNKPVDRTVPEYFMTDESVLCALLCFSEECPEVSPFRLDQKTGPYVAHFGEQPKPWICWRKQNWNKREDVISTIEQAVEKGYRFPPIPSSFKRSSSSISYFRMRALELRNRIKDRLVKFIRHYFR